MISERKHTCESREAKTFVSCYEIPTSGTIKAGLRPTFIPICLALITSISILTVASIGAAKKLLIKII